MYRASWRSALTGVTRGRWAVPACRGYATGPVKEPFNVLFLGSDEFSIASLNALLAHPELWSSIQVVTSPEKAVGRGKRAALMKPPLQTYAQSHGLETHTIPQQGIRGWTPPNRFATPCPSHLLLTASFGSILPDSLLDLFPPLQKLNVHPSLLPALRGAAPIQWTIARGLQTTGVSVQEIGSGVDAGDILGSKDGITVEPDDTYPTLMPRLATAGADVLIKVLQDIKAGTISPRKQDVSRITKAPKIKRETGHVDFATMRAHEIERLSRAISHQYPLWTTFGGQPLLLSCISLPEQPVYTQAEPGTATLVKGKTSPQAALHIACADDTLLAVHRVQAAGRKQVGVSDWMNGLRLRGPISLRS